MARPETPLIEASSGSARFGAVLRCLRTEAKMTQTALAILSNCSPATVSQVERARFLPSGELVDLWDLQLSPSRQLRQYWEKAVLEAHDKRLHRAQPSTSRNPSFPL